MTAPIDYNAVLADLEAKRGQIDAAISVLRALAAAGVTGETMPFGAASAADSEDPGSVSPIVSARTTVATGNGIAIDPNAFFKMSTPAAVKKYLGMVKRPQTPRAIADALQAGGQVHAADPKTAYLNVYSALKRGDEFVQTRNKEWGLAEWYGSGKGSNE